MQDRKRDADGALRQRGVNQAVTAALDAVGATAASSRWSNHACKRIAGGSSSGPPVAAGGCHDGHQFGSREAIQIDDDSEDDIEEVWVGITMLHACML